MSRDFLTVFLYEVRRNLRRGGYLFTSFGIPILAVIALYGYIALSTRDGGDAMAETAEQVSDELVGTGLERAGYVDHSGLIDSPGELTGLMTPYPDEASAEAALNAGEIQMYYIVAADYLETGDITLVQESFSLSQLSQQPITALLLGALMKDFDPDVRDRLFDPANMTITNIELTSLAGGSEDINEGSTYILVYVFAFTLIFSLFMTNGYLMQTVIEEKETRLVEILIASIRPADLLGGKILALGLLGLFQVVAWVVTLFAAVAIAGGSQLRETVDLFTTLANIQISPGIIPYLLIYFLLAYLLFAGLYAIIAAISNSMREGPQYAVIFTIPALLPMYFIPAFASEPNGTIATIMSLVPITAPMAMIQRLALTTVPTEQILLSVGLLAASVVVVMWLAGRIFRVGILLAGNMPKLRDIPKLIRS